MWVKDQFIYKKQYYNLNLVLGTIMQFSLSCIFEESAEYICGSESLLDGGGGGSRDMGERYKIRRQFLLLRMIKRARLPSDAVLEKP
jgi:hypothetical protein